MVIIDNKKTINKYFRKANNIFIMAHKDLDLDALGSSVGMYIILKQKRKNCFLVIDDNEHELGVEKILKELDGCVSIIKSDDIPNNLNKKNKKNLLLILDTNKKELLQNSNVLKLFTRKMIFDHHGIGKSTIKDAFLVQDDNVSSTCEMVSNLVEAYDIELDPYYATILLSGIVLDTNNFTLKTTADTYYAAYFLASLGASAKKVQYLLKQDLLEYTEREKLLTKIDIIDKKIAISKAANTTIYRREDIAKVADTLLFFNDIEASFVIAKIDKNVVGISARSLGNYNITKILDNLGGGGDDYNGAVTFENKTIKQVEELLKTEIKKQEGE